MQVILTKRNLKQVDAVGKGANGLESTSDDGGLPPPVPAKPDDLATRVLKLIPGEVTAGYTALLAVAAGSTHASVKWAPFVALAACTCLIWLLIRRAGNVHTPRVKPHPSQYVMSVLAFWAWAISIRDPFAAFEREVPPWIPGFGIVLVPIFGALILRDRSEEKKP